MKQTLCTFAARSRNLPPSPCPLRDLLASLSMLRQSMFDAADVSAFFDRAISAFNMSDLTNAHQNVNACMQGLLPVWFSRKQAKSTGSQLYTVGAMADSFFEYLLKMWLLHQKQASASCKSQLQNCFGFCIALPDVCSRWEWIQFEDLKSSSLQLQAHMVEVWLHAAIQGPYVFLTLYSLRLTTRDLICWGLGTHVLEICAKRCHVIRHASIIVNNFEAV